MNIAPIKVLYVDDDVALVRLIQKSLGRRGIDLIHASDERQALDLISRQAIDVIALDHYLANTTGLDLLSRLRGGEEKVPPIVYVTGSTDMNVAVAALKGGASDFVVKTVGDDFLVLLASALEQAAEREQLKLQKAAADAEVRIARDRAELLLAEVNHRVANSLALVSSLVNLQAKAVVDQAAKDALTETRARIFAISQVHKRLYSSGDVRHVELDEYLKGLLDQLQTVMRSEGRNTNVVYELAPLKLGTDASINLGVVVTEWVTNAFKYAYPECAGEVRVYLRRLDGGNAELVVEDDGVGLSSDQIALGTGLGSKIVSAMATNMQAKVLYRQGGRGAHASLSFPLPSVDA
jgi:two-component sensor histidine kinase/CheY-like chemotaxis protein